MCLSVYGVKSWNSLHKISLDVETYKDIKISLDVETYKDIKAVINEIFSLYIRSKKGIIIKLYKHYVVDILSRYL